MGEDGFFRDVMNMSRLDGSEGAVLAGVDDPAELGEAAEVKGEEPPEVGGGRVVDPAVDVGGHPRSGAGRVGGPGGGHDGLGGVGGGGDRGDGPGARGRIVIGVGGPSRQGAGLAQRPRPGPCGGQGRVGGEYVVSARTKKRSASAIASADVGTSPEPR